MGGEEDWSEAAPLIRSSGREYAPSYSEDGGRIVDISDQTGADEVWVSDSEGGNRMQITHLRGQRRPARPRWSPDGRLILLELRGGASEIATVPASGGQPKRVITDATGGSWSHDGRSIYYLARVGRIWKAAADGSQPRQLTDDPGMGQPVESADGKYVYYRKWRGVGRMPADGGKEEDVFQPENDMFWGAMQAAPKGWYYIEGTRGPRAQAISFYDTGTKKRSVVFRGVGQSFRILRLARRPVCPVPPRGFERNQPDAGGRLQIAGGAAIGAATVRERSGPIGNENGGPQRKGCRAAGFCFNSQLPNVRRYSALFAS